jgi:hypothetical protein
MTQETNKITTESVTLAWLSSKFISWMLHSSSRARASTAAPSVSNLFRNLHPLSLAGCLFVVCYCHVWVHLLLHAQSNVGATCKAILTSKTSVCVEHSGAKSMARPVMVLHPWQRMHQTTTMMLDNLQLPGHKLCK